MQHTMNSSEIIQKVRSTMISAGYSERSMNKYRACWNAYQQYEVSCNQIKFKVKTAMDFLENIYGITVFTNLSKGNGIRARAIQFLCEYSTYGRINLGKRKSNENTTVPYSDVLEQFKEFQTNQHLISNTTLHHYDKEIGRFLFFLEKTDLQSLNNLSEKIILNYCSTFSPYMKATMHNSLSSLRVFLRYLYKFKYIDSDFSACIPSVPYKRESKLPPAFSNDEIQKVLCSIDRSSPLGKRDYAIILLAYRLGLRSSDIRNLSFSNLHWNNNTINLTMEKTGKDIVLPLLNDVGEAIIDYLKHGRPACDSSFIFVRHITPILQITAPGMTTIVKKYVNKAGIDSSPYGKGGPHAMRSTLATLLLENNIPIPTISEILGHSNTRTTEIYLKLDIPQLRKCCLDVAPYDWNRNDREVF